MRKVNRANHATIAVTAEGCRVETNGNEITLSTPKAAVIGTIGPKGRDLSWLLDATSSVAMDYRA